MVHGSFPTLLCSSNELVAYYHSTVVSASWFVPVDAMLLWLVTDDVASHVDVLTVSFFILNLKQVTVE